MKELEFTFESCNLAACAKRITAYVAAPDSFDGDTGLMLFAHGWSGNRYQYREMQREFADRYGLVCVAPEFRQSGYDFDPTTGSGSTRPYDASHLQVVDCLNAVRVALDLYPGVNRSRLLVFGGSQGAHIAMLACVFAPDTFALAVALCGLSRIADPALGWAGRDFSEDELAIRDVVRMAERVRCPVVLAHGTADETVPDSHTRELERALRSAGKQVVARYYEGASHSLAPVTTRRDVAVELANDLILSARSDGENDFDRGSRIVIPCVTRACVVDWSKPPQDADLIHWEPLS